MLVLLGILPIMQGVTTALVGYIFVCIVMPRLVRHRTQFYAGFFVVLLILAIETLMATLSVESSLRRFLVFLDGVAHLAAFITLVLATGGLSLHELTGEVTNAIEVIRRGEEEKTVIVPIRGEKPMPKDDDPKPVRYTIDTPDPPQTSKPIPLE